MSKLLLILALVTCPCLTAAQFKAGASREEITPPPGFPTGGHGPAGEIARGYWMPLRARAFYINSGDRAIVLVSCDLFAVPLGLQAAVWKLVADKAAQNHVRPGDLILAATHTHQSPGNFMTSMIYNQFGSKYSGFSRRLFQHLSERIAAAVNQAMDSAGDADIDLHYGLVSDTADNQFILNRSPLTFQMNWDRAHVLDRLGVGLPPDQCKPWAGEPTDGWDLAGCPRLRAADRRMTILEIRRNRQPSDALVFFGVHPTVLYHGAPIYSSDFAGFAMESLERKYGGVAGFFNGGEGDIAARRTFRDVLEVRERALQFQDAFERILKLPGKTLTPGVLVHSSLFDLSKAEDRQCSVLLAENPGFGAAALGGAELDRTALYDLGWREGVRDEAMKGQGSKKPALDENILHFLKLTSLLAPAPHFPRLFPVTYAEIGGFRLGMLPVEMSTAQALRIRESFETGDHLFQLIGLANEYSSYTGTASEYEAQDYMAASTIWGPHEGEFLECRLRNLSANEGNFTTVPGNAYKPGPGQSKPFGPRFAGERRELPDEGLEAILLNQSRVPERHLPFFLWDEQIPDEDREFAATRGREFAIVDGTGVVDDSPTSFIKILLEAPGSHDTVRHWAAIWIAPLWNGAYLGPYRFRVKPADSSVPRESKPFSVDLKYPGRPVPVQQEEE